MPFTYTPTIPAAPNLPSQDQPLMLANNAYLQDFGGKDHNFSLFSGNANDGYHKQVTFNTNHATTGFASGVSVMYANTANGQSQVFFNNAAKDVQLTTAIANVPTIAANGCTFLPGGLLLQWGTGTTGVVVNFPVAFNGAGFTPILTATSRNAGGGAVSPITITTGPSNSSFEIQNLAGTVGVQFMWTAIGQAP